MKTANLSETKIVWALHLDGGTELAAAYAGKNAKVRAQKEDQRAIRMTEAAFRRQCPGGAIVEA